MAVCALVQEGREESGEQSRSSRKRGRNVAYGGSIDSVAEAAIKTLASSETKLELGGQQLQFSAHREQVRAHALQRFV
jgi:hypothetical protein